MLSIDKIYKYADLLKGVFRVTDLIQCKNIPVNCNLYLKTENLQVTGSFKVRGAFCKISQLTDEEKTKGVITCSAGNHAQGVALAATKKGISSLICIPESSPISKIEATKKLGAEVVTVKGIFDDAYQEALRIQKESGRVFIPPFNDEDIISGQGTIGLEILKQLEDVDVIVAPIGGGGLISGIAFAAKTLKPDIKVYGVQAANAPSMYEEIKHGHIKEFDHISTIADGIAIKRPGDITLPLCKKYLDDVVTVTEDEIAIAILTLMERQKLVAEGAGAASVAAILHNKLPLAGKKTVAVISGGNIDVTILSRVINRALLETGRMAKLKIEVLDRMGQLEHITKIVSDSGANIVSINHDRTIEGVEINDCYVEMVLETRDFMHIEQIKKALKSKGLKLS